MKMQDSSPQMESLPSFDVASVRESPPQNRIINALFTYPGGRVEARGATLQYLLMEAFNLPPFQIVGGPKWMTTDRFDIQAKPSPSSETSHLNPPNSKDPPTEVQRKMLQSLLIDRFHLKYHLSNGEGPIYVLLAHPKKLKLQPPADPKQYSWAGSVGGGLPNGDGLRGINISMDDLAKRISRWVNRPTHNQTGLEGSYDFEIKISEDDVRDRMAIESSILTSLRELGLELKSSKGQVKTLIVDTVEQPSAN